MVVKTKAIKILIVDDQKSVRAKLEHLLSSVSDFKIIGIAKDGLDAIAHAKNLHPDIIIMDLEMPQIDGLVTTKIISETCPNTKILILSSHDQQEYITQSISTGATGYLLKSASDEEIEQAIRFVYKGYTHIGVGLSTKKMLPVAQKIDTIEPGSPNKIVPVSSQSLATYSSIPKNNQPDRQNIKLQILAWLILTLTLTTGIYLMRQWLRKPIPSLSLAEQSAKVEVTKFSGKIKPVKTFKIAAISPSIVQNIQVQVGQKVAVGQPLITLKNLAAEDEQKRIIQEQQSTRQQQQTLFQQQQIAQQRSFELEQKINHLKYDLTPLKAKIATANLKLSLAQSNADKLPLRQRQDSVPRTKAVYERAKAKFIRLESLYSQGGISQDQLEQAQAELEVAKVDYDMAIAAEIAASQVEQSQVQLSKLEERLAHQEQQDAIAQLAKQKQTADLEYQQATEKLELLSKQAAELSKYQIPQVEKVIEATEAGIIAELPVTVGEQIYAGNSVVELAQLENLKIEIPVSSRLINGLNRDRDVMIQVGSGVTAQKFAGKIATVNPLPTRNLDYLVEVEFANPTESVIVGRLAQVQFLPQKITRGN